MGKPWTDLEVEQLRAMRAAKMSYGQMALALGRTKSAIINRCFVLNTVRRRYKEVSPVERLEICLSICLGESYSSIANKLNYTEFVIRGYVRKSGWKSRYYDNRSKHYLYCTWQGMNDRCYNPNNVGFSNYGGRGISVFPDWRGDVVGHQNAFHNFRRYVEDNNLYLPPPYSMDRINNDGNYEPDNIRWASRKTQALNRRSPKGKFTVELNPTQTAQVYLLHELGMSNKEIGDWYNVSEVAIERRLTAYNAKLHVPTPISYEEFMNRVD